MVRKLIVGLLFVGSLFAQRSDTIFAQLVSGASASANYLIPSQYMIGQSSHQAIATIANAPAKTCSASNTTDTLVQIQGSYNLVNWINISGVSQPTAPASNPSGTTIISGSGVFPFIQIVATNQDTTNCVYSVYYGAAVPNINTPEVITSDNYANNSVLNANANGVSLTERSRRIVKSVKGVNSGIVSASISGLLGNTRAVIDCVDLSFYVSTGTSTGGFDIFTISSSGGPTTFYQIALGFVNTAAVGTVVNKSVCGLNIVVDPTSGNFFMGTATGINNVIEMMNVTYFAVN